MLTLGIDTSCANAGVCLTRDGKVVAAVSQADKRTHSVKLLPEIQALYAAADVMPAQTDLVSVVAGPGSFTGVRIGVATAKMIAYAAGKPIVGVNTLDALMETARRGDELVLPLIDARNARAYACLYENGLPVWGPAADSVSAILGAISEKYGNRKIIICGDALLNAAVLKLIGDASGSFKDVVADNDSLYPDPAAVAALGERIYENNRGRMRFSPESLKINYMKEW